MAIGALRFLAGWNRPSIRPAEPVKMISGMMFEPLGRRQSQRLGRSLPFRCVLDVPGEGTYLF